MATEIETPQLSFAVGLPGFPEARTFVLFNNELARDPFSIMKCLEVDDLEFVVTAPHFFFPGYSPEIDDATAARIGLENPEDAILLVLLTVGDEVANITANLLGPIVINRKTMAAAQAILQGDFELRTPLFPDAAK